MRTAEEKVKDSTCAKKEKNKAKRKGKKEKKAARAVRGESDADDPGMLS